MKQLNKGLFFLNKTQDLWSVFTELHNPGQIYKNKSYQQSMLRMWINTSSCEVTQLEDLATDLERMH